MSSRLVRKTVMTNITLKWVLFFIKCNYKCCIWKIFPSWTVSICLFKLGLWQMFWLQISFSKVFFSSWPNVAFERFFSLMNWFNVSFQVRFVRKAVITNIALKCILFFRNCNTKCYIWKIFHSWTVLICLFKLGLWEMF